MTKRSKQLCYITGRNYRVWSAKLSDDGVVWRDLPKGRIYYDENIHFSERDALHDALARAKVRRDELNDIVAQLEQRLTLLEEQIWTTTFHPSPDGQ